VIFIFFILSTITGLPVIRPLILEYQDDQNCANIDLEYLFGESFLVAPVFKEEGEINVYLPEGEWVDYWTKRIYAGKQNIKYYAKLDTLPLFVKNGSIIPMGKEINYIGEMENNRLILDIYPEDKRTFIVFDEDKEPVEVSYVRAKDKIDLSISEYRGSIEIWLNNVSGCKVIKANVKTKSIRNKVYCDAIGHKTNIKVKCA
jgi:alpha-glucosidase (family GH31 glycosyl hydrolase)